LFAAEVLFLDLSTNIPSNILTAHFSSSNELVIQHAPILCPHPHTSRLTGLNAVRSYFDLIATTWLRSDMKVHMRTVVEPNQVAVNASVRWTWRSSDRSWTEDFLCTLEYDDSLKVVGMIVETNSAPGTCIMRAVDEDPLDSSERRMAPVHFNIWVSSVHSALLCYSSSITWNFGQRNGQLEVASFAFSSSKA
ncbi:hypothetical protein DFH08DRAFT_840271, partial [Mycena albidolilacea]